LVEHDVRVIDKALRVRAARLGSAAMGARLGGLIYGTLVVLAVVISGSLQSMSRRRAAPGAKRILRKAAGRAQPSSGGLARAEGAQRRPALPLSKSHSRSGVGSGSAAMGENRTRDDGAGG
jgi:hypothetical protein